MTSSSLVLDSEQTAIIFAAIDMADAMLVARAARADPDGIVSASLNLQRVKVRQMREQLTLPAVIGWHDIPEEERASLSRGFGVLMSDAPLRDKALAWENLAAAVFRFRFHQTPSPPQPDMFVAPV